MEIKCSQHHDCEAVYLCMSCGFLCGSHLKEQNSKKHALLVINESITELHKAVQSQVLLSAQSSFISQIKAAVVVLLDNEKYSKIASENKAKEEVIKRKFTMPGVDDTKLMKAIQNSIKPENTDLLAYHLLILNTVTQLIKDTTHIKETENKNIDQSNCRKNILIHKRSSAISLFNSMQIKNSIKSFNSINNNNPQPKIPEIKIRSEIDTAKTNQINKEGVFAQGTVAKENVFESITYSEKEWDLNYEVAISKLAKDSKVLQIVKAIQSNSSNSKGTPMIEEIDASDIDDNGAIAIAYELRKNNKLIKVTMLSVKFIWLNIFHWSKCNSYSDYRKQKHYFGKI